MLEVYITDESYRNNKLYGPFLQIGLACVQVLCHYWAWNGKFKLHGNIWKTLWKDDFVEVKDFEMSSRKNKSSSKCAINDGVPQNFLSDILSLNDQKKVK